VSNVLSDEKRLAVLKALVDGCSVSTVSRLTEVNRRTITKLLLAFGLGAQRLWDRLCRDLVSARVEFDEIWSYVGKKEARRLPTDTPGIGEAYSFTAIDSLSRMVITWKVGRRDQATTDAFIKDLRARLSTAPQLTSDGWAPYITAVGEDFGLSIDYMQCVKQYSRGGRRDDHRYEPARDPFVKKTVVYGAPDPKLASTSYVERLNATTRHTNGRMRRLCLAFSRKPECHAAAVALDYVAYNLTHIVRTTRLSPALAANVVDHVWSLPELLAALDSATMPAAIEVKPLAHREPEATHRELPGGRGFLRVVSEPMPARRHAPDVPDAPPPAPPGVQPSIAPAPSRQLNLFEDFFFPTTPKDGG
jgi:IS1 family transposase